MVLYQRLSQIHAIPQKTSVDAEYKMENVLEKVWVPAINRTTITGSVLNWRMSIGARQRRSTDLQFL